MGVFEWDGGAEGGQHPKIWGFTGEMPLIGGGDLLGEHSKIWGISGLHPNNGGGLGVPGFFRRSWGGHL